MIILIAGEKGGTGKSTTVVNLAIMLVLMKHDVIVVDATTGKQASTNKFISYRNELGIKPTPPCVRLQGKHLKFELEDLAKRYEIVIVDSGGHDSAEMRSAMACPAVKKMFSPLKASDFDLHTLVNLDELVYLARAYNSDLTCSIYFNQLTTQQMTDQSIKDAEMLVKDFENLLICPQKIANRISVQKATSEGLSVVEYEAQRLINMPSYQVKNYLFKATLEFCGLYEDIFNEKFNYEPLNKALEKYHMNQKTEDLLSLTIIQKENQNG